MVKEGGVRRISIQAHQLKVEEGIKKKKKTQRCHYLEALY